MRCRPTGTNAWPRAATTTTPSRSRSRACSGRSSACSAPARHETRRGGGGGAGAGGGPAVIADRERRARLANMRQELLAPVAALVGYGELLTEEADRLELGQLAPDLGRILGAARDLLELVNRLLEEAAASDQPSRADLETSQVRMRHDLRNPLNAIKGYAELVLEELDEQGGAALRADLEALLGECESLLARIDVIVDFSGGAGGAEIAGQDQGALASMVANLVRTVKPIEAHDARPEETGRILV